MTMMVSRHFLRALEEEDGHLLCHRADLQIHDAALHMKIDHRKSCIHSENNIPTYFRGTLNSDQSRNAV